MMKRHMMRTGILLTFVLAAVLRGPMPVAAAEGIAADRLLPPQVYFYLDVPSVAELKERWNETLTGQLLNEPALADFWQELVEQFKEASTEAEKELGLSLTDLLEIPSGQVALAVLQTPDRKFGFVTLIDFGESRDLIDTLLDKVDEEVSKSEGRRSSEEFEGTRIVTFQPKNAEEENGDSPVEGKPSYFIKDSYIGFANGPGVLKEVLARWDGEHPRTFADNEVYGYIRQRCQHGDSPALLNWYLDPLGLAQSIITTAGEGNIQAQMVLGFLPALGITKARGMGGSVDMAVDEFDSISRTLIYVDLPTSGLLKIFEFPAIEQAPPAWVTAQSAGYFSVNWDIAGAYRAIESLVDMFQGPGTFQRLVDSLADAPDGPGLHPKRDFIDQLTGQIHVVTDLPDSDEPDVTRMVFALELKDPDKMQTVLATIAQTEGFPGQVRDFRGEKIYEASTNSELTDGSHVGFGVTRSHLMIATEVASLEQIMRGDQQQESLVDSADYQRISRHFPAKTSMIGFQKQDAQLETLYNMLRTESWDDAGLDLKIDFSKLPPFDVIKKYLPATGSYTVPDERGALSVSFSLKNTE